MVLIELLKQNTSTAYLYRMTEQIMETKTNTNKHNKTNKQVPNEKLTNIGYVGQRVKYRGPNIP